MIKIPLKSKTSLNNHFLCQENSENKNRVKRSEKKYAISKSLLPQIRDFIRPFCRPDSNSDGNPPQYLLTTIQLDSLNCMLHFDNAEKTIGRSNLRIRTYGESKDSPYFLEIKRKIEGSILKERVILSAEDYKRKFIQGQYDLIPFKDDRERQTFFDFLYWMKGLNLKPSMLIRYIRESYFDLNHPYARLTIDSNMGYQNTSSLHFPFDNHSLWQPIDCKIGVDGKQAGYILEVKTLGNPPEWIQKLVDTFKLTSIKFCKYLTAVRMDHIYGK